MAFLGFLSGADDVGSPSGVDINRGDFEIKDVDKLFGQSQDEYKAAKDRGAQLGQQRSGFLNTIQQSAQGTGPMFSQQALQQSNQRNLMQQLAAAQTQRGGNVAASQRQQMQQQMAGNAQTAQLGAQGKIQEQQAYQDIYGSELAKQQSEVDQLTQQYLSMGFDVRSAQQKALEAYNSLRVNQNLQLQGIQAGNQRAAAGMTSGLVGGLISAGAGMGAASLKGGAGMKPASAPVADAGFNPTKYSGMA